MLQAIREKATGWIAWIIVILISIPFALFGIHSYLGGGGVPIVASVNDRDIDEREFERNYRDFRQNLRQRLGKDYRPELIDEALLRKEVLDSMIRNELILEASLEMGLYAGDQQVKASILTLPGFTVDGKFNNQAYERAIQSQGLTPAGFEAQIRRAIMSQQLSDMVTTSEIATQREIDELVKLRMQKREMAYLTVSAAAYVDQVLVSDDEIKRYYDTHQSEFMAPEQVQVEYIDLDLSHIASTLTVEDADVEAYYQQNKNSYLTREQRRASHILIAVDEGADEVVIEKARVKAAAATDRINSGEAFAAVAKDLSDDPASAEAGGDLDYFERGIMDAAFDDVVFELAEGDVSDPVRTEFGFHLIKLTAIRAPEGKRYEDAKEDIRKDYLSSEAERQFYDLADQLANLAYEQPDSLEPAAEALGLKIETSSWIPRDGGEGLFASPKIRVAAFSEDVLNDGRNSEAIELGPEHNLVLRVKEHEEAAVRSYDSVSTSIANRLKLEKQAELAKAQGQELKTRLMAGGDIDAIAQEQGLVLSERKSLERDTQGIPAQILRPLFRMPRPSGEQPTYSGAELFGGDFAVMALYRVEDGKLDDIAELGGSEMLESVMERSRSRTYYNHLVDNLRSEATITVVKQEEQ
ncbi:MAG: peptidylprolyl isomerase [Gammaproteobacteria bacterium]|nr:peptidylprolyl isomerase [Gammaproteobacteria bacterium]